MRGVLEIGLDGAGAARQVLRPVQLHGGDRRGGGQRVAGIGVAVEQLDPAGAPSTMAS